MYSYNTSVQDKEFRAQFIDCDNVGLCAIRFFKLSSPELRPFLEVRVNYDNDDEIELLTFLFHTDPSYLYMLPRPRRAKWLDDDYIDSIIKYRVPNTLFHDVVDYLYAFARVNLPYLFFIDHPYAEVKHDYLRHEFSVEDTYYELSGYYDPSTMAITRLLFHTNDDTILEYQNLLDQYVLRTYTLREISVITNNPEANLRYSYDLTLQISKNGIWDFVTNLLKRFTLDFRSI